MGRAAKRLGGADMKDSPLVQVRKAVGDRQRVGVVMGDQERGRAGRLVDAAQVLAQVQA